MTDERQKQKKNKKRFYPNKKENAAQKEQPKDLNVKLQELQAYINGNFHAA